MKKTAFALIALFLLAAPAFAGPPRIAVADFGVQSDNPKLKYIGKGLAEMIAAELAASKGVSVIDRESREAALGEMEFSLSGLADADAQIQAGKLLVADFLLFGEIIDMGDSVLVSCKVIRAETGEVAWADKSLGALADYDRLSRKMAASALKGLGAEKAAAVAAAPRREPKKPKAVSAEKKVEAIVAFSGAVAALDKKDKAEAKRQIAVAKAIDPANAAVAALAAKLAGGSPRFLVEFEKQAATYNPALLGLVDRGSVYMWQSGNVSGEINHEGGFPVEDPRYLIKETAGINHPGVTVPLGERMGLMADAFIGSYMGYIEAEGNQPLIASSSTGINMDYWAFGATLGFGYRLMDGLSLGLGARALYLTFDSSDAQTTRGYDIMDAGGLSFGAIAGVAYRSPNGVFSADAQVAWSNQPEVFFEPPEDEAETVGSLVKDTLPLLASAGAAMGLFDNRVYASAKGMAEFYSGERTGMAIRAIPGVELWPTRWLALRGAYEYCHLDVGGAVRDGHGFMAGLSLVLGDFDLNANFVQRYRPNRTLAGTGKDSQSFLFGLVWNGLGQRK